MSDSEKEIDYSFIDPADAVADELPEDKLQRLSFLANRLRDKQMELARIDQELERQERIERELREVTIPELMKECTIKSFALEDGSKIELAEEFSCSISEERQNIAHEWLRKHNLGGIIKVAVAVGFGRDEIDKADALMKELAERKLPAVAQEAVHWQTLKATLRELREKGKEIPADIFGLHVYNNVKLTPPKGFASPPKIRKRK